MAAMMVHQHNVVPKRMSLESLLSGYRDLLVRVHEWSAFEERLEGLMDRILSVPPLMLRIPQISKRQILKFFWSNLTHSSGRKSLSKFLDDQNVDRIKQRLLARVPGDSERERYLRFLVESAVDEHYARLNYQLPVILKELDAELERLARTGLPPLEDAVFSVPEAFRKPYRSIFPAVHAYVAANLHDPNRVSEALVEIVYDFLARWSAGFAGFEAHHAMQLMEICGRAIARENGQEPGVAELPQGIDFSEAGGRIADVVLRKLSDDVLRSVELAFRRLNHRTAVAHEAGALVPHDVPTSQA